MIHCGANKIHVNFVDPSLASAATTAGITCDTKTYNYLLCSLCCDSQANTTLLPSAFELQQADTTDATAFATIAGYVSGTDYTLPTESRVASNPNSYMLGISLVGKKRYFRVVAAAHATTTEVASSWFQLYRAETTPEGVNETNCEMSYWGN